MREELELTDSIKEVILKMGEGNPGAISVLLKAYQNLGNAMFVFAFVLHLDDMNIRGSQIWLGYKDFCGEDLELFSELVKKRNEEMVKYINQSGVKGWHDGYKAVTSGASGRVGRQKLTEDDNYLLSVKIEFPK